MLKDTVDRSRLTGLPSVSGLARPLRLDPARNGEALLRHVDLAAFDDDGQPLNVWPCRFCDVWHVQVVDEGAVVVREWHAATCEHYQAIAAELAED
jgi:hypothetical protein